MNRRKSRLFDLGQRKKSILDSEHLSKKPSMKPRMSIREKLRVRTNRQSGSSNRLDSNSSATGTTNTKEFNNNRQNNHRNDHKNSEPEESDGTMKSNNLLTFGISDKNSLNHFGKMSDASKHRGTIAIKRLDSLSTKVQQYKNKLRHSESMTEVPNKESTSNKPRSESERKSTKEPVFKEIDVVKQYTKQVFDHFDVN